MITLKNGSSHPEVSVISTMMSVEGLWKSGITGMCHVVELVARCKDPKVRIDLSSESALKDLGLLQGDGVPHDTVKDVVLSMAVGEGLDLTLGSPVQREAA